MSMSNWKIFRMATVAAAFAAGLMGAQAALVSQRIPWITLFAMFAASIPAMLLIIWLQRINPWSAPAWRFPDWALNPFQLREPLQFFHFTGYLIFAAGLGGIVGGMYGSHAITANNQMLVAIGLGQLAGVYACTIVFRTKMAPRLPQG
ncbi:MAG: hypothetical protein H3C57_04010 [Gammaproteobacteria bacterium]|nr:hypothetical protein [Gammaproteobacteria bacterium]